MPLPENICNAYWIHPEGEIYDVPLRHIIFMRDNFDLFPFSESEFKATYLKYGEPLNHEGKARKELMEFALLHGWIRIRYYQKSGWTAEFWQNNKQTAANLRKWALLMKIALTPKNGVFSDVVNINVMDAQQHILTDLNKLQSESRILNN